MIRRTLTWLAVGIALGVVVSMWFGPSLVSWGQLNSICDPTVRKATTLLVKLQLIVGAGLGIFLAVVANLVARRHPAAPAPTQPATKTQ